jgi:hypothetical protein
MGTPGKYLSAITWRGMCFVSLSVNSTVGRFIVFPAVYVFNRKGIAQRRPPAPCSSG